MKSSRTETLLSDSVSSRVLRALRHGTSRRLSGFTLAELIVVVSILAVLATIGFLALSGYQKDAKKAVASTNARSLYTAITTESSVTGYSSRYYVVHDATVALSGTVVVFDGHPASLVGGNWDAPNTNYSAGNPDYGKLKLDREKFRITSVGTRTADLLAAAASPFFASAGAATDASYLLVGSVDATDVSGDKDRVRSYTQVAALLPSGETAVTGDYPVSASGGSTPGLILDTANPSGTGALIDGATVGSIPGCDAASVSGYDVSAMESGESKPVSKTITNGEVNATAYCSFGALSVSSEAAACASGFVPASGPSCVENVCGGTAPSAGAHTETNASSQAVGTSWHYAASAGTCTYACVSGYSWDSGSSSCKADCTGLAYDYHGGFAGQYALSSIPALVHGASGNFSGTGSFGDSVSSTDGELTATFAYTCTDGVLAKNSTDGTGSCTSPNYTWNSSWSAPACTGNSVTNQSCTGLLATGAVWNTASAITQTWSGGVLVPSLAGTYDETASTAECRYKCDSGYAWDSGSSACRAHCASSTPTVGTHSYSVPAFNDGTTTSATSAPITITGGTQTFTQTFSCSDGTVATSGTESGNVPTCSADFSLNGFSCVPKSCKAQLTAYPASVSKDYSIDPDGAGGNSPISVHCDMTTDGGGWTVFAKSTTPSSWTTSNTYGMGQYAYWLNSDNYTYDMRTILGSSHFANSLTIRFYDHVNPSYMDLKYSFNKNDYLAVNFDSETPESTAIAMTVNSQTFSTAYKTYGVWSSAMLPYFRILHQDSYSTYYCGGQVSKGSINVITGGGGYVHATICDKGIRGYVSAPTYPSEYNLNDVWQRVSIAIR